MESKITVKGNQRHASEDTCQVVTRKPPAAVLENIQREEKRKKLRKNRAKAREQRMERRQQKEQGLVGDGDMKQNPFKNLQS